ncbi:hypothetical protein AJ78_08441 [Emergomyces pasteurianus Ep9510]|uniref:Uncharacterized protein n=1 Tax=Emergomyces pasteurianus Ep9510 TaxID=1447872 RepID=A0A1J9P2J1_9EURO|nr:hypothetical protein AJ78_08441 [Emergomyces pasteurianus Ep9510]
MYTSMQHGTPELLCPIASGSGNPVQPLEGHFPQPYLTGTVSDWHITAAAGKTTRIRSRGDGGMLIGISPAPPGSLAPVIRRDLLQNPVALDGDATYRRELEGEREKRTTPTSYTAEGLPQCPMVGKEGRGDLCLSWPIEIPAVTTERSSSRGWRSIAKRVSFGAGI